MENIHWNNVLNNAVGNLGLCSRVLESALDQNEVKELSEKFEYCAKEYCKLDIIHQSTTEALKKTKNYYADKENDMDIPVKKIYDQFYKELSKPSEENINAHYLLSKYNQEVNGTEATQVSNMQDDDDDIISTNPFVPPTDPISKEPIKNPVRNTRCGHIYERETITKIISQKDMRCPYIGCPSKQHIQFELLETDDDLKRKIDRYYLHM